MAQNPQNIDSFKEEFTEEDFQNLVNEVRSHKRKEFIFLLRSLAMFLEKNDDFIIEDYLVLFSTISEDAFQHRYLADLEIDNLVVDKVSEVNKDTAEDLKMFGLSNINDKFILVGFLEFYKNFLMNNERRKREALRKQKEKGH